MKILNKGQGVLWDGKICKYEASLGPDLVQVYIEAENRYLSVPVGELAVISSASYQNKSVPADISEVDEKKWRLAKFRFEAIREYLSGDRTSENITRLSKKLRVSSSRAYVLIRKFDESMGARCYLSEKSGRPVGCRQLDPRVESIIDNVICGEWTGPGTRVAKVWKEVKRVCSAAGYPIPAFITIKARVQDRGQFQLDKLRVGLKAANDLHQARPGKNKASSPLHRWQMDHTVIDCIIVDEATRKPLCRPWVTLIIDVFTRVVMGYYLSIHAPNTYSVAMALTHAVLPKNKWLTALNDSDLSHPYYGRPVELHMDNAKEFKSKSFRRAAESNRIKLCWRPKGRPWWGGHIERLNGTLSMGYVHYLPGTTLSNVEMKGEYDSEKEACLTFSEFRLWFARAIQVYHHEKHRILGETPHQKWMAAFTNNGALTHPALLDDPTSFLLDFLPEDHRVIHRSGIVFKRFNYWSPALAPYVNSGKFKIKYNPLSLKQIWVWIPSGRYIEVPYSDMSAPDITLEELNIAKRQVAEEAKQYPHQASKAYSRLMITQINKNRQLVEHAKLATKRARKARENLKQGAFFHEVAPLEAVDYPCVSDNTDSVPPEKPKRYDIDLS